MTDLAALARLIERAATGDRSALAALYRAVSPQLFGLALGIVRRRDLAEEALQECFMAIWRHAGRFDAERGSAMAWMARILRNKCFDLQARLGRETSLDPAVAEALVDPAAGPLALAEGSAEARALRRCLEELEAKPREGVLLAYYQGLTFEEVARRMGAPLGTVKSWIRRSLMRLKQCLER